MRTREQNKLAMREWRKNNPDKNRANDRRNGGKWDKKNPELANIRKNNWADKNPFKVKLSKIKYRCTGINSSDYKNYGARGIKCLLTSEDLKFLWLRDGAEEMNYPSISRKDHSLSYTIDNCEYMEYDEHMAQNALRYI